MQRPARQRLELRGARRAPALSAPPTLQLPDARLVHAIVVHRHHARTSDNLSPVERDLGARWDCDIDRYVYAGSQAVQPTLHDDPSHPFARQTWAGSCPRGSLTAQGYRDAVRHGADVWAVYSGRLGLRSVDDIAFRTSSEQRTIETVSGVVHDMQPRHRRPIIASHQQPHIDSLVPAYRCPAARQLEAAIRREPAWRAHRRRYEGVFERLNAVMGTARLDEWSESADHLFDALTSRECDEQPRPCRDGVCVDEADVAALYAASNWEAECVRGLEIHLTSAASSTRARRKLDASCPSASACSSASWRRC